MLVYHRVADLPADPFGQAVRPATFERQLRILQRYGTIVPAIRIVERIGRGESVSRLIGVTSTTSPRPSRSPAGSTFRSRCS